ncbi:LacI family DNA-binding transcriptional regulator [Arthrobacter sp. ISL-30]|uniref:LacI family DNA-binding transcriptional regulator n=1 Tax=Arthrobacter sp. ISL-30 TaxID=2819109 RepID=UPI001BE7D39D|nr:LacI family DNA-binding transcriptional regulator [Arthrobacter sp. ISL-30]MBT2513804.1 LacI family DNA-binding transcriptional regulator [Arthrobacter sp. ISL-30]
MKDVARVAGVSHQTVSRVINDHPNVSAKARQQVEAAITELGYRRNVIARSLATRRSQTIGVLTSDLSQFGPARTLLGIERAAREAGHFVSIATLREITFASVAHALDHFWNQGVEGIVVVVPHPGLLEALDRIAPRVAVVAATSDTRRSSLGAAVDQRAGARLAVQHLIELGHTRIGHISGPMDWFDAVERLEGWLEALTEASLPPGPLLYGDWSANSGYAAGLALGREPAATAMFVSNDQMALGLLRALHEQPLRIPQDLSVVGYDDQPEAAYFYPPLTTIRLDFEELGRQCIAALMESQHLEGADSKRFVEPVEPRLILRATTAQPRREEGRWRRRLSPPGPQLQPPALSANR